MKHFFGLLIFWLPLLCAGQQGAGIQFDSTTYSWTELLHKAQTENKLIFIDCYATWCQPCKYMDKVVYPDPVVGEVLNEKFISVKLQFDSVLTDAEIVKQRYPVASWINKKFSVAEFPSYLFFSSKGELVHKEIGAKQKPDFLQVVREAMNPATQYFTQKRLFDLQNISIEKAFKIIRFAERIKDTGFAKYASSQFIRERLLGSPKDNLFSKESLVFIGGHLDTLGTSEFKFWLKNLDTITQVVGKNLYAESIADKIVIKYRVSPYLRRVQKANAVPNWKLVKSLIGDEFKKLGKERILLASKIQWYAEKNPKLYNSLIVKQIENYGYDTTNVFLNNVVWYSIFSVKTGKKELGLAEKWMAGVVKRHPDMANFLDTYANVKYKLGKVDEALEIEASALKLSPTSESILENVAKMKKRLPTWPE